jgi:hypothetical protein
MTYEQWRDSYSNHGMMNEAMARAAWNAAIEQASTVAFKLAPTDESGCEISAAIEELKHDLVY